MFRAVWTVDQVHINQTNYHFITADQLSDSADDQFWFLEDPSDFQTADQALSTTHVQSEFMLKVTQDADTAQRFLQKSLSTSHVHIQQSPPSITTSQAGVVTVMLYD